MIPEAAVEAAAEAAYNATHRTQWWQLSTGYKRELLPPARAALEAAAPHMPNVVNNYYITNASEATK